MTVAKLILIKHALPAIDPDRPSEEWELSEEGKAAAEALAKRLAAYSPAAVVASTEPKATLTGEIIARTLGLPLATDEGLVETQRRTVGFLPRDEFEASICRFFTEPADLVFGEETSDAADARFAAALDRHAGKAPLIVAAHGTVISLYLSRRTGADAMDLWRSLTLPHALVLGADLELIDSIETVRT